MNQAAMNLEPAIDPAPPQGGRLVSGDGRALPLRGAHLAAECAGGIARATLTQRFVNPFAEPLHVTYLLPLPSDGAVAGFAFRIGERRIVGEVDRRTSARERFEQAIVEGRTAALIEQERSSLFTQEVGNIPPRAEVEVEIEIDQRLRWMPEGAWEWRFPTVVGARYLGGEGRVKDADRITVDVAEHGLTARLGVELAIGDRVTEAPIESPSHRLVIDRGAKTRVVFDESAALDRDVVVRWPVATDAIGTSLALARPASPAHDGAAFGLLTLVPPALAPRAVKRDLIFLIDVSGSMHGRPLDQAKRVAAAMIDTLGPEDRVELIAFGSAPLRFADEPIAATKDGKRAALRWLRALSASGATEMTRAVIEALRPLRPGSQRQVVLVTDGYIGFERELVREVRDRLPAGARLHTVGVGSAVNRTLTQWAARAGNGVEVICGVDEDAERVAERLLARTTAPIVTDLTIEGEALRASAPARLPDLYAGSPSLVSLALAPGGGALTLRGRCADGEYEARVEVPAIALGAGLASIATLFGRERVEDLETQAASGDDAGVDDEIEAIGLAFQIATRMTSWIAVSDDVTVDPDAEARAIRQPHEVPQGVSIEGLGLRAAAPMAAMASAMPAQAGLLGMSDPAAFAPPPPPARAPAPRGAASGGAPPDAMDDGMEDAIMPRSPSAPRKRSGARTAAPTQAEGASSERAKEAAPSAPAAPTARAMKREVAPEDGPPALFEPEHASAPRASRDVALPPAPSEPPSEPVASRDVGRPQAPSEPARTSRDVEPAVNVAPKAKPARPRAWLAIAIVLLVLAVIAALAWLALPSGNDAPRPAPGSTEAPLRE